MLKQYKIISLTLALFLALTSYPLMAAACNTVFPVSTEFQIGKIKPIVEHAPKGVYISVGSERSFRGASMIPHVTKVYLLDLSPEIIRFNTINIELLKAKSRSLYRHLRWESAYEEWAKLSSTLTEDDFKWWKENVRDTTNYPLPEALNRYESYPDAQKFLKIRRLLTSLYRKWQEKETPTFSKNLFIETVSLNQRKTLETKLHMPLSITDKEWNWWEKYGKNKDYSCAKSWLEKPEEAVDFGQVVDFKTGNYLFDDKLYEKLHHFALQNRFATMQIDLTDVKQLDAFLAELKSNHEMIAVLDLDNLYRENYIGDKHYKALIQKLLPFGYDHSLLLVMNNYMDYGCAQFQLYLGFTFENVRHWPPYFNFEAFFATLPTPLSDLIDGRLYKKDETPPYHYLLDE